jgi:hypothetical protein
MGYQIHKATPGALGILEHLEKVWEWFDINVLRNEGVLPDEASNAFNVQLNPYFMAAAVEHARVDLSRWADFHQVGRGGSTDVGNDAQSARPDNHKLAGFLARWIAKVRPIQVTVAEATVVNGKLCEMPFDLYRINAIFAVCVLRSYLETDEFPQELTDELIYRLHYRDEKGLDLALYAYCGETMGQRPGQAEFDLTDLVNKEIPLGKV